MEKLIEYLNTGATIAFIGAGASVELGYPSWSSLAEKVFTEVKKKCNDPFTILEEEFKNKNYPAFFQEVMNKFGEKFLYDFCEKEFDLTNGEGKIYSFLSKFPFQAYFTTNFDHELKKHFELAKKAHKVYLNKKKDFEALDIDTLVSIVKIHGDFSDKKSLVLTENQYEDRELKDEYKYFRDRLKSYLDTKRVLFIGYSLNDPDIKLIVRKLSANLRKNIQNFAIMADFNENEIRKWDQKYNIQVIPYNNKSKTHRELIEIFQGIEKYVCTSGEKLPPREQIETSKAQSVYMWHKFQIEGETSNIHIDALNSLLLYSIINYFDITPFSIEKLIEVTKQKLDIDLTSYSDIVKESCDKLILEKLLNFEQDNVYTCTTKSKELVNKYSRQFDDLLEVFKQKLEYDYRSYFQDIETEHVNQIIKASEDVIIDLFEARAIELMNLVFTKENINLLRATNLFGIIKKRSLSIDEPAYRYRFISKITDMISSPDDLEEKIISYYAKVYFSLQALQIDPNGQKFRKEFLANRTILVGSTILIPVIATFNIEAEFYSEILKEIKNTSIDLITIENFIFEVIEHANWAKNLVKKYGEQSAEVLQASLGKGSYKRNAFLDSFIRYCADNKYISFDDFLRKLIGKQFNAQNLAQYFEENYQIKILELDEHKTNYADFDYEKEKIFDYIDETATLSGIEKTSTRKRSEAEAYIIIKNWAKLLPPLNSESKNDPKCSFLSQSGFLNKLAKEGPLPYNEKIIIRADAFYEFLLRFNKTEPHNLSFKSVMLSSYFKSAEYFIDESRYRKFFTPLINEAERIYREGLDKFNKYVDKDLSTDSLDEYFDLEKPIVVSGLNQNYLELYEKKQKEVDNLNILVDVQKYDLQISKKEVEKYKKKEENKKKYAAKQRKAIKNKNTKKKKRKK